jgi:uncharacterized protein YgbK (DUF1537 family)
LPVDVIRSVPLAIRQRLDEEAAAVQPLALALKSGNFGSRDFFEKALAALGTA